MMRAQSERQAAADVVAKTPPTNEERLAEDVPKKYRRHWLRTVGVF